jgi:hypothetical protein
VSRQTLAIIGIAVCSAIVLFKIWVLGDEAEWPWYVWVPILAMLGWSAWQFRERPDPKMKAFDFNPKRGVVFFFLGFLIFPFMLGMNAIFGADISLPEVAIITIAGSLFVGLLGVFTEHVDI